MLNKIIALTQAIGNHMKQSTRQWMMDIDASGDKYVIQRLNLFRDTLDSIIEKEYPTDSDWDNAMEAITFIKGKIKE